MAVFYTAAAYGDEPAPYVYEDEYGIQRVLTPIKGMDGYFVSEVVNGDGLSDTEWVTDSEGNILSEKYWGVSTEAGPGGTLMVRIKVGMADSRTGLLNSDFKEVVPCAYGTIYVREQNGLFYVEAPQLFDDKTDYYDLEGNIIEDLGAFLKNGAESASAAQNEAAATLGCDGWAVSEIQSAIDANIVPDSLQGNYKEKITRLEFCRLAMRTYFIKLGGGGLWDNDAPASPFSDVDDSDVSKAYNLGIVSGRGEGRFAPDELITRQEAAVMLCNLAKVLEVDHTVETVQPYIDESYFADWAKESIYRISGIKADSGLAIMTGTGEGKFSPWFNYQRQQAIATMIRLYRTKCNTSEDFRLSFKEDIDEIAASYTLGDIENSLFTNEKAKEYSAKWENVSDTAEKQGYVGELGDAYRTTIWDLEFCDKMYNDENENKERVEAMASDIIEKFRSITAFDAGEILHLMHGDTEELNIIQRYGYTDKYSEFVRAKLKE